MPKYRLLYFDQEGLGETARLLFAQAGVDYEDYRIERESEWPEFKSKTPFSQVPVLEIDGVQIADSNAVARYLAREFGLAGKNRLEEAHVDMFAAASYDLTIAVVELNHADESKKEELRKKFVDETAPKFLNKFESTLASSSSGFLVGDGVTWADFIFWHFFKYVEKALPAEVMSRYPKVKEHGKKVSSLPKIAEWIAKRPKSER